eukprot:100279_1
MTPSASPSNSPTNAPLSVAEKLSMKAEKTSDEYDPFIYGALIIIPLLLFIIVLIVKYKFSDKTRNVDDQNYICFILFFIQIFDMYSDIIFTVQLYLYYDFSKKTENNIPNETTETFYILFLLALAFTVVPYIANLLSSHRIIISIMDNDVISDYTKDYFRENSSIYSICVLLSGGSFYALCIVNSNLLGIKKLSSGLSKKQLKNFESHKIWTTSILENIPQLCIQTYFIFHLHLVTNIVIISLILSVFNILLSILSALMNKETHKQKEYPFKILLMNPQTNNNSDPYVNVGRRKKLANNLKARAENATTRSPFNFEFLSFDNYQNTKILYGVVVYTEKENEIASFLNNNIQTAVDETFIHCGLQAIYKHAASTKNIGIVDDESMKTSNWLKSNGFESLIPKFTEINLTIDELVNMNESQLKIILDELNVNKI